MRDCSELSEALSRGLGLMVPPIAVAFVTSPPPGVGVWQGQVPSACAFWRRAETETFYAPAEAHFNCPVGSMTMGFELPGGVQEQLGEMVGMMVSSGYLSADEGARIPVIKQPKSGIVYGPLRSFPIVPDLILCWLTPAQAMLFAEAAGSAAWTSAVATSVFGRPACSALAVALEAKSTALSLGCMGMRTFTEVSDGLLLGVVPFGQGSEFAESLARTTQSNEAMRTLYTEHKRKIEALPPDPG